MKRILSWIAAGVLAMTLSGKAFAHGGGHHGGGHHGGGHGHFGHGGFVYFGWPYVYGYPFYGYPYYGYPYGYYRGGPYYGYGQQSIPAKVQIALARRGYYQGPIDGVIGPASRAAIVAYQRRNGLALSGRIDGAVLASLGI